MKQIQMEEIEQILKHIKVRKASGEDNIEPKLIKWMDEEEKH